MVVPDYAYTPDPGPMPSEDALECLMTEDADLRIHDLRLELREVEQEYAAKRVEFEARMNACDAREAIANEKQQRLEAIVADIELHLRQNDLKWIHAKQRYEQEHALVLQKEEEIISLRRFLDKTREEKVAVQFHLSRDFKYPKFLEKVVKEEHESFDSVEAIIGRYEALMVTMDETRGRLEKAARELNILRAELQAYSAEHLDEVLGQTSDMAARSKTVENLRESVLLLREKEDQNVQTEKETRRKLCESLLAIQNVYHRVKTKAVAFDEDSQLDDVMAYIGRRIRFFQETIEHYADLIPTIESSPELMKKLTRGHTLDPNTFKKIQACAAELALRPNSPRNKKLLRRSVSPTTKADKSKFAAWIQHAQTGTSGNNSIPPSRTGSFTGAAAASQMDPQSPRSALLHRSPTVSSTGARPPSYPDLSNAPGTPQADGSSSAPRGSISRLANATRSTSLVVRGSFESVALPERSESPVPSGRPSSRDFEAMHSVRASAPPHRVSSSLQPDSAGGQRAPAHRPSSSQPSSAAGSTRRTSNVLTPSTTPPPGHLSASVRPAKPALKQVSDKELFSFSLDDAKHRPSSGAMTDKGARRKSIVFTVPEGDSTDAQPRTVTVGDSVLEGASVPSTSTSKRTSFRDSSPRTSSASPVPPPPTMLRERAQSHSSTSVPPRPPSSSLPATGAMSPAVKPGSAGPLGVGPLSGPGSASRGPSPVVAVSQADQAHTSSNSTPTPASASASAASARRSSGVHVDAAA